MLYQREQDEAFKGANSGYWCWVEMIDAESEGSQEWTDGTEMVWTSWNFNQPSGGA